MGEDHENEEAQKPEDQTLLERGRENERQIAELLSAASSSIETISGHEEVAKEEADAAKASRAKADQSAKTADESRSKAAAAATESAKSKDAANTSATQARENAEAVEQLLENSTEHEKKLSSLAKVADEKDERIRKYEEQLEQLTKRYESLNKRINSLLPGATSVGLAKSFRSRKIALRVIGGLYLVIFLASIVGLLYIGWEAHKSDVIANLSDLSSFLLQRSPILLALVFLAEFSRRQYGATMRLEEDYAYKETISHSYIGYRDALMEREDVTDESLAGVLSANVLTALSERPGKLLEQNEPALLPQHELLEKLLRGEGASDSSADANQIVSILKAAITGKIVRWTLAIIIAAGIGAALSYYLFAG